jgi:hypothetical protein
VRNLPPAALALATLSRSGQRRFEVTIAVIDTRPPATGSAASGRKTIVVSPPAGFRVVGSARSAADVLYENPVPTFGLAVGGTTQVIAGRLPGKLPPSQIVRDAQLLALDRSVPLADLQLVGLQFVTLQLPSSPGQAFSATIGLSRLGQVNAVELRFPAGVTVVRAAGPARTSTLPAGAAVQFVASSGFYDEGLQYTFTLELSRPLRRGESVLVRASTHYFESVLPFRERFFVP